MNSINFPNMFDRTTTNLVYDYYATRQNIQLLLWSEKGELFGDPYYGTNLKKFLYDQNDIVLQDILIDDIYTALSVFIPQITITRNDIKLIASKGKLTLTIKAINKADFQTNLYNIVLLETDA